jgi:hypothetical protein
MLRHILTYTKNMLRSKTSLPPYSTSRTACLDALACKLPTVEASKCRDLILVLRTFHHGVTDGKEDLDVNGVPLVWVDTTVRTECATTGFLMR